MGGCPESRSSACNLSRTGTGPAKGEGPDPRSFRSRRGESPCNRLPRRSFCATRSAPPARRARSARWPPWPCAPRRSAPLRKQACSTPPPSRPSAHAPRPRSGTSWSTSARAGSCRAPDADRVRRRPPDVYVQFDSALSAGSAPRPARAGVRFYGAISGDTYLAHIREGAASRRCGRTREIRGIEPVLPADKLTARLVGGTSFTARALARTAAIAAGLLLRRRRPRPGARRCSTAGGSWCPTAASCGSGNRWR